MIDQIGQLRSVQNLAKLKSGPGPVSTRSGGWKQRCVRQQRERERLRKGLVQACDLSVSSGRQGPGRGEVALRGMHGLVVTVHTSTPHSLEHTLLAVTRSHGGSPAAGTATRGPQPLCAPARGRTNRGCVILGPAFEKIAWIHGAQRQK